MERSPEDKNVVGLFFCDAMMDGWKEVDGCLINSGMLRTNIRKGTLYYNNLFESNIFIQLFLLQIQLQMLI